MRPTALEPRSISEQKNKVFHSMLSATRDAVVRGQPGAWISGSRSGKVPAARGRG
jgi:hypothetical protein